MDAIALTLRVQNQSYYDTVVLLLFSLYFDSLLSAIDQAEIYCNPTQTCTFCTEDCLRLALYLYYKCTGTNLKVQDKLYREPVLSPLYRLKNVQWDVTEYSHFNIKACSIVHQSGKSGHSNLHEYWVVPGGL